MIAFVNRKSEDYENATKIIAASIPDFKIVPFTWNGFSIRWLAGWHYVFYKKNSLYTKS